ncbi:hypothetical protein ACFSJY_09105 [Thalassotalea euphylliae]|uniref:hypothetical protein n=1 Tax=Thalassotalea euphylliae TaxID=1655234 RepID=UPI003642C822
MSLIKNQKVINVVWTMTSKERERELLPVRVPLFMGLGGCRVFLIKKGNQPEFNNIHSEQALKRLYAGQGADWPDTEILEFNEYNVVKAAVHDTLFSMLEKGRFDYFPRAMHEAFVEVNHFEGLAVEETILLKYTAPFFFFVSNENKRLAERLEYGLVKMYQDGSFAQFFESNPYSSGVLSRAGDFKRKVFNLKNPLLSKETSEALENPHYEMNCGL